MLSAHSDKLLARPRSGFTLTEILIAVAILAMLIAVMVGVSQRVGEQGRITLTKSSLRLLNTAVREFYDENGHYPVEAWVDDDSDNHMDAVGSLIDGAVLVNGSPKPASDELLYLQLSILPQSRAIIASLSEKLLAAPHSGATVQLAGQDSVTPYLRSLVDAWGHPLIYDASGSYPVIRSNSPDGNLGGGDDISNGN